MNPFLGNSDLDAKVQCFGANNVAADTLTTLAIVICRGQCQRVRRQRSIKKNSKMIKM